MAKRIACLSSILSPEKVISYSEQVYQIFDSARRYNKEHAIVGIFLVYQDTLLQIFEGDGNELAQVIYRTNRDPRLTQISVIANQEITTLKFTRWNLKLIHDTSAAHSEYLDKINRLLQPNLRLSSTLDKIRYEKLIARDNTEQNEKFSDTPPSFSNTLLSMKSWPRPTALRMDAGLMKICPLLIHKTVAYDRLKELQIFAQNDELDRRLLQLHKINALQVTQQKSPGEPHRLKTASKPEAPKSSHSFSQALRQFISQHRAKGGSHQ
ncbi:BLUF domain-containing protein [Gilvimarinus sp. DA14]|uniref:BLUF domain-containing protein n=1 Tax=Gilvimarinus sp. DA14 TaxID=2956798 RepID=UPI0020B77C6D|nr:BLUF domain-containing protein [Gilvimarinus sp. DA14]UTF60109.1 BLUF domain-containing protein [Gilvimarinus sp. DA14]